MANSGGSQLRHLPSQQRKAREGSVQIRVVKGRLRLVWSAFGQRYFLSRGMDDSPLVRKVAEAKASLIAADINERQF
jgi:hypothetical protein